ncbi:hypothetical protein CIHG_03577 [Coccidioides immitis H538.4]|uniref:Uncharacterized protein n=2 Tax=Coccidioides immitis TaxID=5501 RepID=A0A0J8RL39_COCIT|nr:hypothetical protein CIRG_04765 [Coccidioides immitis RMSCC 2394]KMU85537.1 hypothetical protein CIHG_03577 [Coccidioides immitis H538.4]
MTLGGVVPLLEALLASEEGADNKSEMSDGVRLERRPWLWLWPGTRSTPGADASKGFAGLETPETGSRGRSPTNDAIGPQPSTPHPLQVMFALTKNATVTSHVASIHDMHG